MSFFVLTAVLGVPLSWHTTLDGDILVWVGFELLLESHKIGIAQRRAEWFVRWTAEIAAASTVHIKAFEEGLDRIMFVVGAVEHERPFVGPLYKFLSLHPRSAVRHVPPNVAFILEFLSRSVMNDRHCDCNTNTSVSEVSPRVDAQASATRTGIGGWFPKVGPRGQIDCWQSHWFSMEIRREDFPCVFESGNKPALLISTLEALAVLTALKLYYGDDPDDTTTRITLVPMFTVNRANGSALNKLMSTTYPSSALLMELSSFLKKRRIKALVKWAPRESNQEADRLADGDSTGLNPELELKADVAGLRWNVLPEALVAGRQAEEIYLEAKSLGQLPNRAMKEKRRRVEDKLRTKDPW